MAATLAPGEQKWLCSCGESATYPFCDGACFGSAAALAKNLRGVPFTNEGAEAKTFYFCACGHTKSADGTCDGSHQRVKPAGAAF